MWFRRLGLGLGECDPERDEPREWLLRRFGRRLEWPAPRGFGVDEGDRAPLLNSSCNCCECPLSPTPAAPADDEEEEEDDEAGVKLARMRRSRERLPGSLDRLRLESALAGKLLSLLRCALLLALLLLLLLLLVAVSDKSARPLEAQMPALWRPLSDAIKLKLRPRGPRPSKITVTVSSPSRRGGAP